jgi:hypothetical protein
MLPDFAKEEAEVSNYYVLVRHMHIQPSEYAEMTPLQIGVLVLRWNEEQEEALKNQQT